MRTATPLEYGRVVAHKRKQRREHLRHTHFRNAIGLVDVVDGNLRGSAPSHHARAPRANRRKVFVHIIVASLRNKLLIGRTVHRVEAKRKRPPANGRERLIDVVFEFEENALGIDDVLEWTRRKLKLRCGLNSYRSSRASHAEQVAAMNSGFGVFLLKRSEHVAHAVGLTVGDRVARAIDANMLELDSHSTAFGLRARAQMRHDCRNVFLTRRLARSELRIARSSCFPHKVLISLPRSTTPTRCRPSCGPKPCMAPMVTRARLFQREHKTIPRRRCQLVGKHDENPALNRRQTRGFGRGL